MKCFYHTTLDAVATCSDCTKGLCSGCSSKYNTLICLGCNSKRAINEKQRIKNDLILMFVVGLIIFVSSINARMNVPYLGESKMLSGLGPFIGFYVGISFIAGWKKLNNWSPKYFLILPLIGWLVYLILKFYFSFLIGFIYAPFKIYADIKRLKQLNRLQKMGLA